LHADYNIILFPDVTDISLTSIVPQNRFIIQLYVITQSFKNRLLYHSILLFVTPYKSLVAILFRTSIRIRIHIVKQFVKKETSIKVLFILLFILFNQYSC